MSITNVYEQVKVRRVLVPELGPGCWGSPVLVPLCHRVEISLLLALDRMRGAWMGPSILWMFSLASNSLASIRGSRMAAPLWSP